MPIAAVAMEQLRRMPADEPVFVLRAQDMLAVPVVHLWVAVATAAGVNPLKILEARKWADIMEAWPTKKLPD